MIEMIVGVVVMAISIIGSALVLLLLFLYLYCLLGLMMRWTK